MSDMNTESYRDCLIADLRRAIRALQDGDVQIAIDNVDTWRENIHKLGNDIGPQPQEKVRFVMQGRLWYLYFAETETSPATYVNLDQVTEVFELNGRLWVLTTATKSGEGDYPGFTLADFERALGLPLSRRP